MIIFYVQQKCRSFSLWTSVSEDIPFHSILLVLISSQVLSLGTSSCGHNFILISMMMCVCILPEKEEKGFVEDGLDQIHRLDLCWHLGPIAVYSNHVPRCCFLKLGPYPGFEQACRVSVYIFQVTDPNKDVVNNYYCCGETTQCVECKG